MEDVLDFSADFWEKRLDYEPENVDNIYSKKGISYANHVLSIAGKLK